MAKYALISTMKNEAPFILEWVAHYKALGFDEIVICTNDCSDSTAGMIQRLEYLGYCTHHPTTVRRGSIHRSALRQAERYDQIISADWTFICDVDEFLNIHVGDGSVRDLVAHSGDDTDVISIPWRIFGPDGASQYRDQRVTQQFRHGELPWDTDARPGTGKFVKSIFRHREKFQRLGLHAPVAEPENEHLIKRVLPGGALYIEDGVRTQNGPVFDIAQVNHYALRSLDSYLVKRDRGRANHTKHVLGMEYWDKFNLNDVEDRSIDRYEDRVKPILADLYSDFRIERAHIRATNWHQNKAAEMRSQPDIADIIAQMEATLLPALAAE
jgi:hypothetical protein